MFLIYNKCLFFNLLKSQNFENFKKILFKVNSDFKNELVI